MEFFQVQSVKRMRELIEEYVPSQRMTEDVLLSCAQGRTLAKDVKSREDVPAFSRSTVDGYALKAADTYGAGEAMPAFLNDAGAVEMGKAASIKVRPGEAVYVPTGAMIPEGADAVVMIEDAEMFDDLLTVMKPAAKNENIIWRGEDCEKDGILFKAGRVIRPQEAGTLASLGITEINVYRQPVIGYLSSGDEIVPYDTPSLQEGEIRDVNGVTIPAMIEAMGGKSEISEIAKDERNDYLAKASALFERCDMVILSGGSSVGTKDFTTEVMTSLGDQNPGMLVHGLSVKPGKPTIFAVSSNKPVLGLPGHPGSAMVIFQMFGKSIIARLLGQTQASSFTTTATVSQNIPSSPGRTDFIRVTLDTETAVPKAVPVLGKSGLVKTLVKSDGLLEIEEQKEGVLQGETVTVHYFI
ncbi:gephyrin-like molybdotransferase Glp [Salisediminibacterium halotolerans]|uniref:Molybdopterin molybdenumtransferase n=1 Tax=Salisediminibacterium halotolerans TaxID=517425 RepID=A0A1H9UXE2_9BACI|nr:MULTISPECIES: gephyrin-like molybdotransferase Glp [Salisediminibacterium]RLJ80878.1 molybdopterin molybdochelatase [Actinophytocola xinjiangensis]RPE83936.1 molybdopterin molybdotransferase [Salisediminibacterium halotolerans]TWG37822.1 molybdopterin molybdochelatase [Salisediminibacterium halotolerans]SES13774.1 molybdopterin molybdotransferase [Salisediminibacterium haloalkalitolerans]GEL09051.1 molybdopterin molybdenumtransferase MoeA [Salisediminibacterium halotolerans]